MTIRPLSELEFSIAADKPMKVCVVSSEFLGPVRNGGIATATSGLLKQLVSDGHKVTLLYTLVEFGKPATGDKPWKYWVDALSAEGISVEHIANQSDYWAWREKSWRVKEWIGNHHFDVVYFNEHHGNGYYALAAKRAGLAPFSEQLHCLITHGSIEWVFDINDQYSSRPADLEMSGLERRSVEMADVVIGPSQYLLKQYEKYGWRLPAKTFQHPYPLFRDPAPTHSDERVPVEELVFFGRLETRKGLWLFCEALDRLSDRLRGKAVTFLGRTTDTAGISSGVQIVNRSGKWPCRVRLLAGLDHETALSYLKGPAKLAVMPSLADNSPCVLYECMEAGIPFVSTRGSGGDELVDPACWPETMVEPTVEALTERLAAILQDGAKRGQPRFDPKQNLTIWSAWHRHVAASRMELIDACRTLAPSTASRGQLEDSPIPLIVVVDRGTAALSLLIENLRSHVKRFGGRAAFLVLSARRGELQAILFDMLNSSSDGSPGTIIFLDTSMINEVRRVICGSRFVFFMDAEIEMLTPFFLLALNILRQQHSAVVSCAGAVRRERDGNAEIEELPTGDVPGLSALGYPIGGPIWAVSGQSLTEELEALDYYDKYTDLLASASTLGQSLLHRCRLSGVPLHVLPIVGAIETRYGEDRLLATFSETRKASAALGVPTSVHAGGAPWFAISTFGMHHEGTELKPVESISSLPQDHPLTAFQSSDGDVDLAALAAAMGRPELSLQIESGNGGAPDRIRSLSEIAIKSRRLRPTLDLSNLLRKGSIIQFGNSPEPSPGPDKVVRSHADNPVRDNSSATQIYINGRPLRVTHDRIRSVPGTADTGPARLLISDVLLSGNSWLLAKLRSASSDSVSVQIKVFDQQNGEEMGAASRTLSSKEASDFSIPLHHIYGRAAILLELSGGGKIDLVVEAIRIE